MHIDRQCIIPEKSQASTFKYVQSVLPSQLVGAYGLTAAVQHIEIGELAEVTFVCTHATHRSVGMACLLAILIYNNATIMFSTTRTQADARKFGMIDT